MVWLKLKSSLIKYSGVFVEERRLLPDFVNVFKNNEGHINGLAHCEAQQSTSLILRTSTALKAYRLDHVLNSFNCSAIPRWTGIVKLY
ncbi:hypothetical protein SASPL_147514 [Salvia splendens]|uniref:Uncharacterized protein n=1 Tax=Salvia splendens TaxID=180675 RepID=A0A8X8WE34_SALSN|nr:hypothetical protein SASPL_147514 [Salvia splendens]